MTENTELISEIERVFRRLALTPCNDVLILEGLTEISLDLVKSNLPLFRHPLGFVQFESEDMFSIMPPFDRARIHIFKKGYSNKSTSPSVAHSHNWKLKSAVVLGEVENNVYDFNDSANGRFSLYQVNYNSKLSARLLPIDRHGELKKISSELIKDGRIYCQDPAVLHSSTVNSTIAVTFLLAQTTETPAMVVFPSDSEIGELNSREEISIDDREELFRDLSEFVC